MFSYNRIMFLNFVVISSVIISIVQARSNECGYHSFDKIYAGEYTALDEFPWLARLEYIYPNKTSAGYFCGGALVSDLYVLTAAHCIINMQAQNMHLVKIRLGEYNASTPEDCVEMLGYKDCADAPLDVGINAIITHTNFSLYNNDIAIIKLDQKIEFTDFIRPICLPTGTNFRVGSKLSVSGWGTTENSTKSDIKLKVELPVVSFVECFNKFHTQQTYLNPKQHICAGGVDGKDSCKGDSGSPLMSPHRADGRWEIVGITSTGNKCGIQGWPAVYTRVINYMDWIKGIINKS